jgi:hypothetical protein
MRSFGPSSPSDGSMVIARRMTDSASSQRLART